MKKVLSLLMLITLSSNTYSESSSLREEKIQAYANLIKAKTQTALAETKLFIIDLKEKSPKCLESLQSTCNSYLALAKDKLSNVTKNNSADSKIQNIIKEAKKLSDSAAIYAKENPNVCIAAGVTTACFLTYYLYKKCCKTRTN